MADRQTAGEILLLYLVNRLPPSSNVCVMSAVGKTKNRYGYNRHIRGFTFTYNTLICLSWGGEREGANFNKFVMVDFYMWFPFFLSFNETALIESLPIDGLFLEICTFSSAFYLLMINSLFTTSEIIDTIFSYESCSHELWKLVVLKSISCNIHWLRMRVRVNVHVCALVTDSIKCFSIDLSPT